MKKPVLIASLIPLLCNPVSAVELGSVKVGSYLNQPFSAVLSLNDVTALDLADIRFSLAGREAYQRFNLLPPANLKKVKFKIVSAENGRFELHMTSKQRVLEPILNILLQVNERQGDFFRQYTLLIDPPQSPMISTVASIATEPRTTNTTAEAVGESPNEKLAAVEAQDAETILVKDRSISMIAQSSSLHDKFSVYQIMRAFYQLNEQAFEKGNIDKLISGSRLVVPSEDVVGEVPRQQAVNFVYSVSRDLPGSAKTSTTVVEHPAPETRLPAVEVVVEEAPKDDGQDRQSMQRDVAAWRSMANEFTTLNGIVESQNDALISQHAVVKNISLNIEKHASLIERLSSRLEQLESGSVTVPAGNTEVVEPGVVEVVPAVTQEEAVDAVPVEPKAEPVAEAAIVEAADQATEAPVMPVEVAEDKKEQQVSIPIVPEPENDAPGDVIRPVPEIVTYSEPEQGGLATPLLGLLAGGALLLLAAREWVWRRRLRLLDRPEPVSEKKATTYSPSRNAEEMGTLELKNIEAKCKADRADGMHVTNKSSLRLESSTADGVKIEIEVLLAYEQYEEALQLLALARDKFGEADWIDYKTLEIYAATNQCEEFLALFNDRRGVLEAGSAIAWDKITRMRDQLCEDFNISAIG